MKLLKDSLIIIVAIACFAICFMIGLKTNRSEETTLQLVDELAQLYAQNWVETANPNKHQQLRNGMERIVKLYRCPSAMPDLKASCNRVPESVRILRQLLKEKN
jgi:hypothetical protein